MLIRPLVLLVCLILMPAQANAKISLNPEKSVSNLIRELQAAIHSIISAASWEAQVFSAQTVNSANILLSNIEESYKNTVDKTVSDLSVIEKDAFERLSNLVNELEDGLERVVDRPLAALEDITALLADNLLGTKPIVTRYSPTYVGPIFSSDVVRINIGGLRLHAAEFAKPKLEIVGEVFHGSSTDRSITFDVPRDVFGRLPDKPANVVGKLTLEGKSDSWTVNRFLSVPQVVVYNLRLIVLPEKIGEYVVSGATSSVNTIREDYVPIPPSLRAEGGPGMGTPQSHCYHAPEGTEFDLGASRPEWIERYGSEPGGRAGRPNPAVNIGVVAFDPRYAISKTTICLLVTAGTGCKGCPAVSVGRLVAQTIRRETVRNSLSNTNSELKWDDIPVDLDETISGHTVSISLFGGPRRTYTLSRSVQIPPFLRLDVDSAAKKAIIRPLVPTR